MSRAYAKLRKAMGKCTVAGWIGWLQELLVSTASIESRP